MKKNKILHMFLTIALVFTMLTPVAVKAETVFRVIAPNGSSTTQASFGSAGGTYNLVVVTNDNSVWTATTSASWITTSKQTGRGSDPQVTISVASNDKREARSGKVSFSTSTETYVFYVSQSGNPYAPEETKAPVDIFIQKSSVEASPYGQTVFIGAGSNYAWTATSDSAWIYFVDPQTSHGTADQYNGMYIGIRENTTNRSRVGHITVSSCNESKTITITQAGK